MNTDTNTDTNTNIDDLPARCCPGEWGVAVGASHRHCPTHQIQIQVQIQILIQIQIRIQNVNMGNVVWCLTDIALHTENLHIPVINNPTNSYHRRISINSNTLCTM